jgi:hypothetical protein
MILRNVWPISDRPANPPSPAMSDAPEAGFSIAAAILVVAVGIIMSALPNGIAWWTIGYPVWIPDGDERFYLALASQAYFNHTTFLSDPVFATGGVSLHCRLPILPGEIIAKALHLGPLGISPVWRVWAGVTIALGWYLVVGHYVKRPWITAGLVILLLSDRGLRGGRLLVRQMSTLWDHLRSQDPSPLGISAWRIGTPSLTQVYLLLHLWLLARARDRPSWSRFALSGLGFGLLFYVYPYYWTSACAALLVALVLDAGHRKVYFHTGWIGGLIGLPHVVNDLLVKRSTSPDWLIRSDRFVPFPRFEGLDFPKMSLFLIVAGLVWVVLRRKDLIYLWTLSFSAFVLSNHQLLTAMQLENFHWNIFVYEPCIGLFVLLVIAGELSVRGRWSRPVLWGLLVICCVDLVTGVWVRAIETTESRRFFASFDRYKIQRLGEQGSVRLAPNAVLGGDEEFVDFALIAENQRPLMAYAVYLSPSIDNAEWEQRIAVNGYLLGLDRRSFEARQVAVLTPDPRGYKWGPWTRDPVERMRRIAMRMAFFDAVTANPSAFFERYMLRYVALPSKGVRPAYLNSGWRCLQEGPVWSIWERLPVARGRSA